MNYLLVGGSFMMICMHLGRVETGGQLQLIAAYDFTVFHDIMIKLKLNYNLTSCSWAAFDYFVSYSADIVV